MKRLLVLLIVLTTLMALPQSANAQAQWTWKTVNSGTPNQLNSVIWTGSQFVAVGSGGKVLTSPNGINWTSQSSGSTNGLNSVIWTGSQLVAVGSGGKVLTSPDGVNWTTQNSGTTRDLYSITWTGSQLVAVGGYFSGASSIGYYYTVLTSPDGITWTTTVAAGLGGYLNSVIWADSQLVAVGANLSGGVSSQLTSSTTVTSPNGIIWHRCSSGNTFTGLSLCSVIWSGSQLVAVGGYATSPGFPSYPYFGNILTSSSFDSITWTKRMSVDTAFFCSVTFGSGRYVVVGLSGIILQSIDGINWSYDSSGTTQSLYSVTPGNAQCMFVAVGANGTIIIYSSSSGTSVKTTPNSPAVESLLHAKARNSLLTISLPSAMLGRAVDVAVYSASGRVVMQKRIAYSSELLSVSVPNLAVGAYVLSVKDGIQKKAVRFVVAR